MSNRIVSNVIKSNAIPNNLTQLLSCSFFLLHIILELVFASARVLLRWGDFIAGVRVVYCFCFFAQSCTAATMAMVFDFGDDAPKKSRGPPKGAEAALLAILLFCSLPGPVFVPLSFFLLWSFQPSRVTLCRVVQGLGSADPRKKTTLTSPSQNQRNRNQPLRRSPGNRRYA